MYLFFFLVTPHVISFFFLCVCFLWRADPGGRCQCKLLAERRSSESRIRSELCCMTEVPFSASSIKGSSSLTSQLGLFIGVEDFYLTGKKHGTGLNLINGKLLVQCGKRSSRKASSSFFFSLTVFICNEKYT